MSKKVYDVVAVVGRRKDDKPNYVNCGVVIQGDKGLSMKLNSIPAGNEWNGWFSFFEPRERGERPTQNGATANAATSHDTTFDSEIPF
jgi:hypothetical protein